MTGFTTAKLKDMSAALNGFCILWKANCFIRDFVNAPEACLAFEMNDNRSNDDQSHQRAEHNTRPLPKLFHLSPHQLKKFTTLPNG
jgi:hypothetical protein